MVITLLNLMLWITTIGGYLIYNLYRKNEVLEGMVIEKDKRLAQIESIVQDSDRVLKEIDRIGAFKSDDEIGFFFNTVKEIQQTLNDYTSKKI